jgi:hypothetical protein
MFASRNQMFAHVRQMKHYGDAQEGGQADTGKQDAEPTADDEGEEEEGEEGGKEEYEEEYDDETDGDEDEEPPTDFRAWNPFPESPYNSSEGSKLLQQHLEAFNATSDWDQKLDIAIKRILKPFLDPQRPKFSDWPEEELKLIFRDARALPTLPTDATRYFCSQKISDDPKEEEDCKHDPADECWCYFDATASAGIPGLSPPGRGIRKDRKACIAFMHKLVTQFLLILAEPKMEFWDDDEKWTLYESIKISNPSPDDNDDDDDDDYYDDDRTKYLTTDSYLQHLTLNGDNKQKRTENDLLFLRLCGTLGRRMLTLGVCHEGDGSRFAKKHPMRFWDIAGLVQDLKQKGRGPKTPSEHHFKRSPRPNDDKPLNPTRVINTHTYEFEDDTLLYQNNYAILSHTWTTKGKEVEYPDAEAFLLQAKKDHLQGLINRLQKNKGLADRKDPEADIKARQQELDEVVKKLSQKKETTSKPTDDFGTTKLAKAIDTARALKFTYLWADKNAKVSSRICTPLVSQLTV